jgi:hypothetical protein
MIKKKTALALLLVLSGFSLAAQEGPRVVLSDAWVDRFISNWDALSRAMAEVTTDSEMDSAISHFMETFVGCIVAQSSDFTEYRASFLVLTDTKFPPEGERFFIQSGLGPDSARAIWVCMIGFMLLTAEEKADPDWQEYLAKNRTELRQIIYPGDFAILEKNLDRLSEIFN